MSVLSSHHPAHPCFIYSASALPYDLTTCCNIELSRTRAWVITKGDPRMAGDTTPSPRTLSASSTPPPADRNPQSITGDVLLGGNIPQTSEMTAANETGKGDEDDASSCFSSEVCLQAHCFASCCLRVRFKGNGKGTAPKMT